MMTSTVEETKSAQVVRQEWLQELTDQLSGPMPPSGVFLHVLERIRTEGPTLARQDFGRWQRRFRWVELQIGHKKDLEWIVVQSLIDMNSVNNHAN
jgi:hypothetical protein